jgi:hypothetical protein
MMRNLFKEALPVSPPRNDAAPIEPWSNELQVDVEFSLPLLRRAFGQIGKDLETYRALSHHRRPTRVESWSPSSDWVPPWQDKATLCMCLCLSENTVDAWVRQGLLLFPRKRGGKLMWRWSEVEKYLEGDDPQSPEELGEGIRNAT